MGQDSPNPFKLYLIKRNLRPATINYHLKHLKILQKNVRQFTKQEVDKYFLSLKEKGCKNTYINKLICNLRVYAQFACLSEELQNYKFLPEEKYVKATMSDKEIEDFLGLPPPTVTTRNHWNGKMVTHTINPKLHHRWTVFFSIMAYTGMRPGEVASLSIDDVDWGRGVFVLDETKTNDFRYVPIPPNIEKLIKGYLEGLEGKELFPRASNVDWGYNFHTRLKRLGIKRKNLTPYSLRHSFITQMLEEDVNLFKVQKIVGHRDLRTTAHYTHLTTKDTIRAIKKHPLVRKGTSAIDKLRYIAETIKGLGLEDDKELGYEFVETEDSLNLKVRIK